MKKLLVILFVVAYSTVFAQSSQDSEKYVEVRGSAEMLIEPDEIIFGIQIVEFWQEKQNKDSKDFMTKYSLKEIEDTF